MAKIRITVDGKPALTVEQAAERHGLRPSSMRGELTRLGGTIEPAAMLDGRKPLYDQAELDAAMAARPGRGGPGVSRPHIPPAERDGTAMGAQLRSKATDRKGHADGR